MTDSPVYGTIHLDRISDKRTRDLLRQAADMAKHGDTVWIVSVAGEHIAGIVSPERAVETLPDDAHRP